MGGIMTRADKLRERFQAEPPPRDFTWPELVTLLSHLNYDLLSGSGSRRRFVHRTTQEIIILHEPHPGKILKPYQIRLVREKIG